MDKKAAFGAKGQGEKETSLRGTLCGWAENKWMLVTTFLAILVVQCVVGAMFWFFNTPKEHQASARNVLRTLQKVSIAGGGIDIVNSTLTTRRPLRNISLSKEEQVRLCMGGMVTVVPGGRFGNHFLEWASAWAVSRSQNLTLATPTALQDTLHQAFSYLPTGPTIRDVFSDCRFGQGLEEEDAFGHVVYVNETEAIVAFAAAVANASSAAAVPGPLALRPGVILSPYIARTGKELREQVVWREDLSAKAQTLLRHFGSITAENFGVPPQTVVFVGMHVRRTDFSVILNRFQLSLEANTSYFCRALRHLHRTLEAEAGERAGSGSTVGPLAVVVSSDDMPWVHDVLLPALHNFTQEAGISSSSFAGGLDHRLAFLQDLALLSSCNHTIISYGTYGMTAAFLAGGHVVAFTLNATYPTAVFAQMLPNWMLMR